MWALNKKFIVSISLQPKHYSDVKRKNVESFLSRTAHKAVLISVFLALSQTPDFTLQDH